MKSLLLKVVPATFVAGILVGVAASTAGAALKGSAIFMDVPYEHYANDAIGEMAGLGIIKGLDSTHFGPDDPITRGQVAILLQRLRNELKGTISSSSSSRSSSSSSSSSSSTSSSSSSSSTTSSAASLTAAQCSPGGCVHFGSREYNVEKNDATGIVTILIARTGGNTGGGTVDYAFNTGTAVADKDYKPVSGTLTFNSKETSKKIQLQIINNTAETANKNVVLKLSNPTGALKIDSPNPILLNINDPRIASSSSSAGASSSSAPSAATTVTLSASAYAVAENAGTITVTVLRTGVTTGVTDVDYSTGNGSALSGTDYTSTSGKLTFAAGETSKTFTVSVADNTTVDGAHVFSVNLSNPTNSAALDLSTATVTINDNESIVTGSGSFRFSSSTYTVLESAGKARITVNHAAGTGPSSVGYATTGGSALTGSDYTAVSGTLNFAQGEVSKVFYVPIVGDGLSEGEETVNLTLQSPTGAPLGDPVVATLKIND